MKVILGVSNRHIHLTKEDYFKLFNTEELVKHRDLKQPGEFASQSRVTIKTSKNEIKNVRVLGPFRNYTQVEISKTDSYFLGINPPIRNSGDLNDAEEIKIIGDRGEITRKCCIIPTRHIHISNKDRLELGLNNIDYVSVRVGHEKKTILENVYLKESKNAELELHLDTDDGNGSLLETGDFAELII